MGEAFFDRFEAETVYSADVAEEYHRHGFWGDMAIGDYLDHHAAERGDDVAVIDDTEEVTWAELRDRADAIAAGLREQGVEKGTPVAFQLPHRVDWFALRLGVSRAGGISVPVYPRFGRQELVSVMDRIQPRVYVGHPGTDPAAFGETVDALTETVDELAGVFALDGGSDRAEPLASLSAGTDGFSPTRIDPDYPDVLALSSGTTGMPKIYYVVQNTYLTTGKDVMGRGDVLEVDTVLVLPPVQQALGHIVSIYLSMVSGASVAVTASNDPADQWAFIDDVEPTVMAAIPTQSAKLVNAEAAAAYSLESVRVILHGGAPLPIEVAKREEELGATVLNGYGAGDGAWATTVRPTDRRGTRFETVGPRIPSIQLRIIDDTGDPVPRGEVGEVLMRGGGCGFGYYGDRERTEAAYGVGGRYEGWFHSNDAGFIDDRGNLTVVGRIDDMIIRGGQNVYPKEIEDVLMEHDGVAEAAVIGVPDAELGERIGAYVVETAGSTVTKNDVVTWFESKDISKFKWPEEVYAVDELPRSPGGKIDKAALREQHSPSPG